MIWLGLVAFVVVIVMMIIDVKICYSEYAKDLLTKCAEYYGYDWGTDIAHDSLADCRATLYCYKKMKEQKELES